MILSHLPTDNLYKFHFIAGLTIMMTTAILFINKVVDIQEQIHTLKYEIALDQAKVEVENEITNRELGRQEIAPSR